MSEPKKLKKEGFESTGIYFYIGGNADSPPPDKKTEARVEGVFKMLFKALKEVCGKNEWCRLIMFFIILAAAIYYFLTK